MYSSALPPSFNEDRDGSKYNEQRNTSHCTCVRTTELQPVSHQESIQQDNQPNLPPVIAPVLLLPPPLSVSPLISVGSGPEPDKVRMGVELLPGPTVVSEGAGVPVEVELLLGVTVVTVFRLVPVSSGSPIQRLHQKSHQSVGQAV